MVICLERGADLHMAQLMPLSLTVSCFSKIHIGFTFLVPAHPGNAIQSAVKRVCVCVCQSYGDCCHADYLDCMHLINTSCSCMILNGTVFTRLLSDMV